MTRSDAYAGVVRKIQPSESLAIVVPEIKGKNQLIVTHNAGATNTTLLDTEQTFDLSKWSQPGDFKMYLYPVPRDKKSYSDDGVVTVSATHFTTGKVLAAGYTTAVTKVVGMIRLTFSASKYDTIKRILFYRSPYPYYMNFGFTDIYGNAQVVVKNVKPTENDEVLDLRVHKIDRTIAASLDFYYLETGATGGIGDNGQVATDGCYINITDPIIIQFDCYNDLDEMVLSATPFVSSQQIAAANEYVEKFMSFLAQDYSALGLSEEQWRSALATAIAYSVENGWKEYSDFNRLEEIRALSFGLVGIYSKIIVGDFSNITVPEHFINQIETALFGSNLEDLLLVCSIWSISDDVELEFGR